MNFPRKAFILSCSLALLAFAGRASAATFTVNTTDDSLGAGGGVVSLRDAVTAANAAGGTNTINFDATVFAAVHGPYTIQLTGALPDPTGTLILTGPGAKVLSIQGPATSGRLFVVASGQTVSLSGLTFTGFTLSGTAGANGVNAGTPPIAGGVGMGGVIKNSGALSLSQCVFANNSVSGGAGGMGAKGVAQNGAAGGDGLGGAIYSDGTSLIIDRCTFSQNSARGGVGGEGAFINDNGSGGSGNGAVAGNGKGGALYLAGSSQTITTSTFAGNTAAGGTGGAGGIPDFGGSENAGGAGGWGQGGAIYDTQSVTVKSCTIGLNAANPGDGGSQNNFSDNAAEGAGFGSGIFAPAVVTIGNTIVAGNTTTDAKTVEQTATDVAGVYVSEGFNLIGVNDTASGLVDGVTGDKVGSVASPIDAKLDPAGAQYNGGSLPTLRLRKGSPAVDGGTDVVGQGIDEDGNPRPVDLDNSLYPNAADGSDIGAWEAQALPDDAPVISPTTQTVSGTVGVAITSANQVQATDGDSDPLTYSVVSGTMPAGLTFNSNGTITGTPTAAGQTSVTFKANDGLEDSNTGTLNLNITEASSLVVNTDLDVVSAYDGLTSLREALIYEANNGLSTPITFDPTFFATPRTITLSSSLGPLTIYDGSATITGSAAGVTIDGGNAVQVFNFFCFDTQTVMLNQLTLAHGNGSSATGGGAVQMQNIGGTAQSVELTGCTVSGNTAVQGAGIFNSGGGALTLINCTVAGNQATGSAGGGGIALQNNSTGSILDSTIALNSAPTASGGGVLVASGCSLSLGNSIVASNTAASDPDLQGAVTSQGYNLIGDSTGAAITGVTTGNLLGISPGLDTAGLASNGGPTQTIALTNASPALDQGKAMGAVTIDQRGQTRPFDLGSVSNASGGDGSDIGAFELVPPVPTVTSINPTAGPLAGGTSVAIVGTNFTSTSTVAFGGSAASSVIFNSATSLTAAAPAHAAGAADITVTDSGQTSATGSSDQFTYVAAPVFSSGATAGGIYHTAYAGSSLYTAVASNAPTYGIASGTLPTGLTLDPVSGNLTGTPTQTGSFPVTLSATNAGGTVTQPLAITIGKATAAVALTGFAPAYTGLPINPRVTTNPIGLLVDFTYGGSGSAPTEAGTYSVTGTISDPNYQGSVTGSLTIQKASQSIFFPAPVPTVVGAPVALSASTSSGLAVTYTVSGNATLSGSTVTPLDTNPVSITGSQSGNADYLAAPSITRTITATAVPLQPQTITVGTVPSSVTSAKAFTLNSTASSGLPVTYTLTGGPATISGATVTPTGLAGTITIVISQAGNSTYSAAPSVTITVPVSVLGAREFFGTFTVVTSSSVGAGIHPDATLTGTIAATINATNTSGTLLGTVGGSAFVATITIAADGTYTGATTAITAPGSTISGPLTFAGTLSGNTLSGTIAELHASFSIPADSTNGVTAFIAGFYAAAALDSSSGSTYTVVGTQGELLVVTIASTGVSSAMGTVSAAGVFTVSTAPSVTVAGSINFATTSLTVTVTTPTGGTVAFSGLSGATAPTDRLVNLSSRGTVSGANELVSGLVIGGSVSKTLLLRAIGPGLGSFGISGALAHPHLQLFDSTGKILSDTTAWGGLSSLMSAFSLTGAFPLAATSADAAVLMTLAPGQYTIQVGNAATDAGGVALAEIYDADANPGAETQRLINISTRAFVSPSTPLTGGFVVTGNTPKTVLVRGIGPGLTGFGIANALSDPALTLFDGSGNIIAQNDNWGTPVAVSATQVAAAATDITAADLATGAFALTAGSKDAALIVTLPTGSYTAQVTGVGGASGTALVEIYEIPAQ